MARDVTQRFGDRAEAYERGRPRYPDAAVARLCEGLAPGAVIADVGAGTGILTEALVERGFAVRLVEPNDAMRAVAQRRLEGAQVVVSAGRAEATGLEAGSVARVVAAQAFHWFDPAAFRAECDRILAPGGQVALLWNDPSEDASPFMAGYAALLQAHRIDEVRVSRAPDRSMRVARFFGPRGCRLIVCEHPTWVDWASLEARLSSSSYMPAAGSPGHSPMIEALRELFDAHAEGGHVCFEYTTALYVGELS